MKIRLDTERCTGHGRCYTLAPGLFDCDDRGHGLLTREDVPPELEGEAHLATDSCPERAISIDA